MSVNLNLDIRISGVEDAKCDAVWKAFESFLDLEGLSDECEPIQQLKDGTIFTYTMRPVIISRSFAWVPDVTARLKRVVEQANGGPCQVNFGVEYKD